MAYTNLPGGGSSDWYPPPPSSAERRRATRDANEKLDRAEDIVSGNGRKAFRAQQPRSSTA
jgi:hypothetical protein